MVWELFLFMILLKILLTYSNGRCTSKVCLVGKTAIITGGNSGLGLETAKSLASRGCKIIIADKEDATDTVTALQKETHNSKITSDTVDFASFQSVRNFAKTINSTVDRVDILINNAGMGGVFSEPTEDGLPMLMQVNYLSHFLLVHLLADLLQKSAPCRILNASSIASYLNTNFTTENIEKEITSNTHAYRRSKLLLALASKMFANKFKATGVTSNCYHPGFVRTAIFGKSFTATQKVSDRIAAFAILAWTQIFGKSVEEGCQPTLHLAMADEVKKTTGKFFWETCEFPQPSLIHNDTFCEEVWKLSEQIVGLKPEEKLAVILKNEDSKGK